MLNEPFLASAALAARRGMDCTCRFGGPHHSRQADMHVEGLRQTMIIMSEKT